MDDLETQCNAKNGFVEPQNISKDEDTTVFECLAMKLLKILIFNYFWQPSWTPSWIVGNVNGLGVPTQQKFKMETKNSPKMQRNTYQEKLQGEFSFFTILGSHLGRHLGLWKTQAGGKLPHSRN